MTRTKERLLNFQRKINYVEGGLTSECSLDVKRMLLYSKFLEDWESMCERQTHSQLPRTWLVHLAVRLDLRP